MEGLRQVFLDFTSFGAGQSGSSEMDSAKFVKLAKDCKLVGKGVSTTDLDLIFTKVKDKTAKKINFDTFVAAVGLIAEKVGKSTDEVIHIIVSAKGPTTGAATVADDVRFHDDKSTFTGVHNSGGPTNIDSHNVDMANQLDRSEGADVRGVKTYQNESQGSRSSPSRRRSSEEEAARRSSNGKKPAQRKSSGKAGASATAADGAAAPTAASPRKSSSTSSTPAPRESTSTSRADPAAIGADGSAQDVERRVADVFVAFASSVAKASGEMDSAKFFKLMGDSGLTGKTLSRTDCDLIFTKTCSASGCSKKIHFDAFRKVAVALVAAKLQKDESAVLSKIASVTGVSSSGTVAQASRFHDDKKTYTGSHAAGGPTHVDQRVSLENLANRGSADVRGVQASVYKLDPKATYRASVDADDDANRRRSSGSIAAGSAMVSPMIPSAAARSSSPKRSSRGSVGSSSGGATGADRRKSSLAEAGGTIAGSANKKGGVYDRLCDQKSYTGVYAERFKGDGGRINGDTVNDGVAFSGNTNSGGDHAVRDLSQ
ncbi:unnamed protein product [Scytosiphon promiscuus]